MAEQRITTKPTVNALLDEDYIFINHDGALRQVRKSDADLASSADLQAFEESETAAREQFEENLTEANEEFVETVDDRMNAAESIVYGAFITKTASGDIASFSDGADDVPMKSLNVTITPKQSGIGDPSPSNVRPISGFDTVNISLSPYEQTEKHTITGKNLYNAPNNTHEVLVPCHIPAGSVITFSEKPNEGGQTAGFRCFDANKVQIDYWTAATTGASDGRKYRTVTIPSNLGDVEYVEFYGVTSGIGDFMVELGSTYTGYEPYGVGTPVPLGQTVYGGEVNPISGELKITDVCLTLTGEESGWADAGNTSFYNMSLMVNALAPSGSTKDVKGICSHDATNSSGYLNSYIRKAETYGGLQFYDTANYWGISGTDLASKLNYLKAQYTNGTPVQIKYELATPTTVQLTPAQVATLLGTNNVWADCGSLEVEYRADPTLAYAELQALILENL